MGKVLWNSRGFLFDICTFFGDWNPVGGIYIFSRFNPETKVWEALYVGKTESFRSRIGLTHEKLFPAMLLWGATHVLAVTVPLAGMRTEIEQALIQEFDPPLNTQLRPKPVDLAQLLFPIPGFVAR